MMTTATNNPHQNPGAHGQQPVPSTSQPASITLTSSGDPASGTWSTGGPTPITGTWERDYEPSGIPLRTQIKEFLDQRVVETNLGNIVAFIIAAVIPVVFGIAAWVNNSLQKRGEGESLLQWLTLVAAITGGLVALNQVSGMRKAPQLSFFLAILAVVSVITLAVCKMQGIPGA